MTPKAALVVLGILASLALAAVFTQTGPAEAERGKGAVAHAGDAVVSGADARVVGGPTVVGAEAWAGARAGKDNGPGGTTQSDEKDKRSTPPSEGKAVLRMGGDDGVGFSGTCSVGGEEKELKGKVPAEFSFDLNGEDLECEVRKAGGDGTLKIALTAGSDRVVQRVGGDGTVKFDYSGNGVSSSTSSGSNVVSQSSSVSSSSGSSSSVSSYSSSR